MRRFVSSGGIPIYLPRRQFKIGDVVRVSRSGDINGKKGIIADIVMDWFFVDIKGLETAFFEEFELELLTP